MLKYHVDRAIWTSVTYDEFLLKMKEAGYEIRQRKYLAFRAPEQKHFTNVKSLGAYYADENIVRRLVHNRHKAHIPVNASYKVRMFIEMTNFIAEENRPGYDRWAKRNNLKEAAKTFNYLSQHHLLNYEDFQNHISDLESSIQAAGDKIQDIQKHQNQLSVIKKHCDVYRACREVVLAEKDAPDKELYRKQHHSEYILHDSTLKELASLGIDKLPSEKKLARQAQELDTKLSTRQKEKQDLLNEQKTLQIIESNFEHMVCDLGLDSITHSKDSRDKRANDLS